MLPGAENADFSKKRGKNSKTLKNMFFGGGFFDFLDFLDILGFD